MIGDSQISAVNH